MFKSTTSSWLQILFPVLATIVLVLSACIAYCTIGIKEFFFGPGLLFFSIFAALLAALFLSPFIFCKLFPQNYWIPCNVLLICFFVLVSWMFWMPSSIMSRIIICSLSKPDNLNISMANKMNAFLNNPNKTIVIFSTAKVIEETTKKLDEGLIKSLNSKLLYQIENKKGEKNDMPNGLKTLLKRVGFVVLKPYAVGIAFGQDSRRVFNLLMSYKIRKELLNHAAGKFVPLVMNEVSFFSSIPEVNLFTEFIADDEIKSRNPTQSKT